MATGIRRTGSASFTPGVGGLLDHLCAPRHPLSAPPTWEWSGGFGHLCRDVKSYSSIKSDLYFVS